jgi:hypothetical protein
MIDTWLLGRAFSATTTELVQQMGAGAMITVSQQTVSRTGSQQTGWETGAQQTGWETGAQQTGWETGSQQTGSQHTGSQQAALRW